MSKRDARFIMGTPLVEDPFHDDRWIYYYSFKPGQAKSRDQQAVTLVFEADTLSYVEADTELENVPVRQLEPLDTNPQDDKGFFSRWFGRD